jgi:hypothetical protein
VVARAAEDIAQQIADTFLCVASSPAPNRTRLVATEDAAPRCKRDREASLHYPRYVQEPRATGIGCTNRLLGAEHDYLPMGGQICQGVCKGSKVADASAENLVAPALEQRADPLNCGSERRPTASFRKSHR